jgi:cytochrome c556
MRTIFLIAMTLLANGVLADGEAEYKYREGVMRAVGGHMSSMGAILRGRVHFDDLKLHANAMSDLAKVVPHVFPEGSGVEKSEATSAVWENAGEFKAAMDKFVEAADGMAAAANGGDMSAVGPAIQALGQSCKNCHDNFREEHDH